MKKKIFLHLGSHKTGTTTLQKSLASNREILRSKGLIYPVFDNSSSHASWANFIAGECPQIPVDRHRELTSEWLNNLGSGEALLLSAESLYRHIQNQKDYLLRLKTNFMDCEIIPVICLRRQGDYAKSLYGEWVTNWQYQHSIYRFIKDYYSWFNYEKFVSDLNCLGNPIIISYHKLEGRNLCSEFLQQLGFDLCFPDGNIYLRSSPSDAEIYLKRKINENYPVSSNSASIRKLIGDIISEGYNELMKPIPELIWFGIYDAEMLDQCYKYSNQRLCFQFNKIFSEFFPLKKIKTRVRIEKSTLLLLNEAYLKVEETLKRKRMIV